MHMYVQTISNVSQTKAYLMIQFPLHEDECAKRSAEKAYFHCSCATIRLYSVLYRLVTSSANAFKLAAGAKFICDYFFSYLFFTNPLPTAHTRDVRGLSPPFICI